MKIVFVCTANICRSPLAEFVLKKWLKENNITDVEVSSAGTCAYNGAPMSENSLQVLSENNIDASDFRSTALTIKIIEKSDFVITMTREQKLSIEYSVGKLNKVKTLGELGGGEDVSDPYLRNLSVYNQCFEQISDMVIKFANTYIAKQ